MTEMLTEEKLRALREAAQACDYPGPWANGALDIIHDANGDLICDAFTQEAGDLIAECDRDTVLALLGRIAELERDAAAARTMLSAAMPSERTRDRLMQLCQDQGELTVGQRVDQVVEAYDQLRGHVAELEGFRLNERILTAGDDRDRAQARVAELEQALKERVGELGNHDRRLEPGGDVTPGPEYARDFDSSKGMPWALRNGAVRAARFDLSCFHVPSMRVVSVHLVDGRPYVQVELEVRNRDTGELTSIAFVRDVDRTPRDLREEELSDEEMRRLVWQGCVLALAHELDECLKMDGKRLREPHPGEPFHVYDFRRMDGPPATVGEVGQLNAMLVHAQHETARERCRVADLEQSFKALTELHETAEKQSAALVQVVQSLERCVDRMARASGFAGDEGDPDELLDHIASLKKDAAAVDDLRARVLAQRKEITRIERSRTAVRKDMGSRIAELEKLASDQHDVLLAMKRERDEAVAECERLRREREGLACQRPTACGNCGQTMQHRRAIDGRLVCSECSDG